MNLISVETLWKIDGRYANIDCANIQWKARVVVAGYHVTPTMEECMARKSDGFNLSAVIREFRSRHRGVPATQALEAVRKAHKDRKINEGTFKATFYKLAGRGSKKTVRRRKPRPNDASGGNRAEAILRAGLTFVRLAGGVENAHEQLKGLEELIETAKAIK
jgi:hypothetical protein